MYVTLLFICYVYLFYMAHLLQEMESVQNACRGDPVRNQPWFAAFLGDGATQYITVLERKNFAKTSLLETAIYLTFSLYCCLNLGYPDEAKWIFSFFQDFILDAPDHSQKSATYLSVTSDLKRRLLT